MVYISNGHVLNGQNRSLWSLSFIKDFFWGILDFIIMFFKSMIHPNVKRGCRNSSSDSKYDDGRGPPGYPRRGMGRINHSNGPSPPPMAGGGGR
uniref:Selenoprotein K n=1 Tax=Ornithorhynchus anatinus TaxID=9258 RepID=F6XDX0_ORNAN